MCTPPSLPSHFKGQVFVIKCFWSSSHCFEHLCNSWNVNVEPWWKKDTILKRRIAIEMILLSHMMYNPTKGEVLANGWWREKNWKRIGLWRLWKGWDWGASCDDLLFLLCLARRGVSVAPFGADKGNAKLLQDAIPRGGVRLRHHPNIPKWSNWIHALQQRSCKCASLGSCQSQQRCQIVCGNEPTLCWFAIEIGENFSFLCRKQISRNQQRHSQRKKLKLWTLNITTQKFTEPRSSCLNLPKRFFKS